MSYKKKTEVMNQISSVSYWAAQKGTSSKDHIIVIIHQMLFLIELHKRDNSSNYKYIFKNHLNLQLEVILHYY